jgi:heavy-metal-associated domain-containing protein
VWKMLYIHHVPGRLRLQTPRLKGDVLAAEAARNDVSGIPGVSAVRASAITGSLIINTSNER